MASYKLKTVPFCGSEHPVVLQNENGPCPLIAAANVLILRGRLKVPPKSPDISQERLMALVAEHLLDTNLSVDESSRYAADLRQNLQDVIGVLPKMATGVDVNPKFDSIRGFEFTNEVAIFDLMNISLVHGWLFDPQDERHATVLRNQSYNQVVSRLVAVMGEQTPKHLLTPQNSMGSLVGSAKGAAASEATEASSEVAQDDGSGAKDAVQGGNSSLDDFINFDDDAVLLPGPPTSGAQPREDVAKDGKEGEGERGDTMEALVQSVMSAMAKEIASVAGPKLEGARTSEGKDDAEEEKDGQGEKRECAADLMQSAVPGVAERDPPEAGPKSEGAQTSEGKPAAAKVSPHEAEPKAEGAQAPESEPTISEGKSPEVRAEASSAEHSGAEGSQTGSAPSPGAGLAGPQAAVDESGSGASAAALESPPARQPKSGWDLGEEAENAKFARVAQDFLESTSSQLTVHGLYQLLEGLNDNELAVFFRNNHFNTMYKRNRSLYILVTDQGYLSEEGVVWERLDGVDGDTQYVTHDFVPYTRPQAVTQPTDEEMDLQRALAESVGAPPPLAAGGDARHESPPAIPPASVDADYALALQLHEEMLAESERNQASAQAPSQPPQQAMAHSHQAVGHPATGVQFAFPPISPRQQATSNQLGQGVPPAQAFGYPAQSTHPQGRPQSPPQPRPHAAVSPHVAGRPQAVQQQQQGDGSSLHKAWHSLKGMFRRSG